MRHRQPSPLRQLGLRATPAATALKDRYRAALTGSLDTLFDTLPRLFSTQQVYANVRFAITRRRGREEHLWYRPSSDGDAGEGQYLTYVCTVGDGPFRHGYQVETRFSAVRDERFSAVRDENGRAYRIRLPQVSGEVRVPCRSAAPLALGCFVYWLVDEVFAGTDGVHVEAVDHLARSLALLDMHQRRLERCARRAEPRLARLERYAHRSRE